VPETWVVQPREILYARSGDVSIAYEAIGAGPPDVVLAQGYVHNLALAWEHPRIAGCLTRLASFCRLIRFDRRGSGLSDRVREVPTLEARMDDLRAVMDDAKCERAAIVGTYEAAPMAILFSATYPERTVALVLYHGYAKGVWSPEYPWANSLEEWRRELAEAEHEWGSDEMFERILRVHYPTLTDDEEFRKWFFSSLRFGASPSAAATLTRMQMELDVRDLLPAVRVPTLILHRERWGEEARYLAERIPGAKRVELPGSSGAFFAEDFERTAGELEAFIRSAWHGEPPDTVLTTVLFTDIVDSTKRAAELGDRAWTELTETHHAVVRRLLDRFRGRELDTAGDGFFAAFDGPARAIRCAFAVVEAAPSLGLEVRAGLHTGECEVTGTKVAGIAVNIGARIAARAGAGEVLVSSTVKDLVAGSEIEFSEHGVVQLKGVPDEWLLYRVETV
jgi:class 3 adenylate cyclase